MMTAIRAGNIAHYALLVVFVIGGTVPDIGTVLSSLALNIGLSSSPSRYSAGLCGLFIFV